MCVFVLYICMFMDYMNEVSIVARRRCQILQNWRSRWMLAAMEVLGIKSGASKRIASVNCSVISQATNFSFKCP